ncbi:hypothetical protein BKA63DRAFT_378705, partial [Paraphoma chrysanthemicola]
FGPSLEYYCAQRGLRFGHDLQFIYRWPAPTPNKPHRERYVDIAYRLTPVMIKDKEYPSTACKDGDTIYVMKPRPGTSNKPDGKQVNNPMANMLQLECQPLDIQTGETTYQHRAVAQQWSQITDIQLAAHRRLILELERSLGQMEQVRAMQNTVISRLQQNNAGLNRQLAMTRQ